MPVAALYSRVSTSSGEQLQALEQQRQRLLEAVPEGFTPVEYTDIQSGRDTDRPAFNRLMQDVRSGAIATVLATRLDRLARNRPHGAELLDTFSAESAPRLHLLDDHLDLATVGGRLMAGILSAWAIAESERLAERTRHGHAHRRSLGKPFGPKPPRGYIWNEDRSNYEPGPDADLCRQVIERFQSDPLVRPIVRWAAEQGLVFGSPSSFVRWASNPALAGARVYGVSKLVHVEGKSKPVRRHNKPGVYGETYWDAHPALITREQHAWLIAHFATTRQQATAPLRDGRIRIVSGLSVCSHCQKRLSVHQSSPTAKRWYRCNNQQCDVRYRNRVPEVDILAAACGRMQLEAKRLTEQAVEAVAQAESGEPDDVKRLREEIAEYKAKRDPDLADAIATKESRLQLLLQRDRKQTTRLDVAAIEAFFGSEDGWRRMAEETPAQLREVLLANVAGVLVRDCTIEGVVLGSDLD